MTATIHALKQGSDAWHQFRSQHFGASEAAAMLGVSKYQSRSELLRAKATGITPEVSSALQAVFDKGHETEIGGRSIAEGIIGEDLFPATYSDGKLSASCDGLTILGETAFEHKQYNAELFEAVTAGILPESYQPQCQQVMLVTGAERLLFMVSDGTPDKCAYTWVEPDADWQQKIVTGWALFEQDLANYVHTEAKPEAVGRAPDQLPALLIEVTGRVTASNLTEFRETALAVFNAINTDLQTDQDFADAEKAIKFCRDAEDRLESAKSHALSQTASIDELFRTIDAIKEEARTVRLKLDKLVKAEKENRKAEIITQARQAIEDHIAALNKRLGGHWMPQASATPFADAIKGLKSLESMRDKVSTALANAKIAANEVADRIQANRDHLTCTYAAMAGIAPDFAAICHKAPEDFQAVLAQRAQKIKDADAARQQEDSRQAEAAKQQQATDQRGKSEDATHAQPIATAAPQAPSLSTAPNPVIEAQDTIAGFIASREWAKGDANRVRAILVEYEKFKAQVPMRKAA